MIETFSSRIISILSIENHSNSHEFFKKLLIRKNISFSLGCKKKQITLIFTNKKAVIFTMAAFIVLSMFLDFPNQKYHYFLQVFLHS